MGITLMAGNHQGWGKIGKELPIAPTGDESTVIAVDCGPEGLLQFAVGECHDAHNKAEKKAINQGFSSAAGWVSETMHDTRVHAETAAVIVITRNFRDENGQWVRARFTRVS